MTELQQERPILFSGEMVRAILDGRKTQTRRVIKRQPISVEHHSAFQRPGLHTLHYFGQMERVKCPYGVPGDRLWVRETWQPHVESGGEDYGIRYRADQCFRMADNNAEFHNKIVLLNGDPCEDKWRPSIHMPRWASRITLEVTEVRCERLQDISYSDAVAEGTPDGSYAFNDPWIAESSAAEVKLHEFQQLWNSINSGDGVNWAANPWVWVVGFQVAEGGQ